MSGFTIDLNLYGPILTIPKMIKEARSTEETGLLYIAIEKGRNPGEGCDVSYIGIDQQQDKGSRFPRHHKLVRGTAKNFSQLWAGYLYRLKDPYSGSHDDRLKTLEDILISWFLPPDNKAGVSRSGNKVIGTGAYYSAQIHMHWWTMEEKPRQKPGIRGFPKQINYSKNRLTSEHYDWITATY